MCFQMVTISVFEIIHIVGGKLPQTKRSQMLHCMACSIYTCTWQRHCLGRPNSERPASMRCHPSFGSGGVTRKASKAVVTLWRACGSAPSAAAGFRCTPADAGFFCTAAGFFFGAIDCTSGQASLLDSNRAAETARKSSTHLILMRERNKPNGLCGGSQGGGGQYLIWWLAVVV